MIILALGFTWRGRAFASRDQAGGTLSCAAVPRGGLGPLPPP
jgi:hypothetical protein